MPDLVLLMTVHELKMYSSFDVFKSIAEIMQSKFVFKLGFFSPF